MGTPAQTIKAPPDQSEWEDRRWFPPGPRLTLCLAGEHRHRLPDRSDDELIEIMAAARRQTSWAQARELAAVAELVARREREDQRLRSEHEDPGDPRILSAGESLIEEISAALAVTGNTAATLMDIAQRLDTTLPATRAALESGIIDLPKARIICDAAQPLPDRTATLLEAAVLERAPHQTTGQLRRRTRTLARRLAPDLFDEHTHQTVKDRRVELWDNTSGTAVLTLFDITTEDAHAIHNKLTAAARTIQSHRRAQQRAQQQAQQQPEPPTSTSTEKKAKDQPDTATATHDWDDFECGRTLNQIRADLATRLLRGHPLPNAITALLTEEPTPEDISPKPTPPPAHPTHQETTTLRLIHPPGEAPKDTTPKPATTPPKTTPRNAPLTSAPRQTPPTAPEKTIPQPTPPPTAAPPPRQTPPTPSTPQPPHDQTTTLRLIQSPGEAPKAIAARPATAAPDSGHQSSLRLPAPQQDGIPESSAATPRTPTLRIAPAPPPREAMHKPSPRSSEPITHNPSTPTGPERRGGLPPPAHPATQEASTQQASTDCGLTPCKSPAPSMATPEHQATAASSEASPTDPGAAMPMRNIDSAGLITALAADINQRLTRTRTRLHRAGRSQRLRQAAIAIMRDVCRSLGPFRDTYCPTDEQGRHGYPGYRPPAALRRMLLERHTTCVFPTCNRRAEHCDIDHTIAYDDHGPTCGCNLAVLCRRHHRCKQRSDWHLFQPWPGLLIWITPAGTWHIVQPD